MSPATLKKLVLYAALALSPAVLSAQGMTGNTTPPTSSPDPATRSIDDQATKPIDIQSDAMAYQKELEACDTQAVERDSCRSLVDEKYSNRGSSNTPLQGTARPTN